MLPGAGTLPASRLQAEGPFDLILAFGRTEEGLALDLPILLADALCLPCLLDVHAFSFPQPGRVLVTRAQEGLQIEENAALPLVLALLPDSENLRTIQELKKNPDFLFVDGGVVLEGAPEDPGAERGVVLEGAPEDPGAERGPVFLSAVPAGSAEREGRFFSAAPGEAAAFVYESSMKGGAL